MEGSGFQAGPASAVETARQALMQLAWLMALPQQSSAGVAMPMLSHGWSADWAHALASGPKASQKASNAAMKARGIIGRQRTSKWH